MDDETLLIKVQMSAARVSDLVGQVKEEGRAGGEALARARDAIEQGGDWRAELAEAMTRANRASARAADAVRAVYSAATQVQACADRALTEWSSAQRDYVICDSPGAHARLSWLLAASRQAAAEAEAARRALDEVDMMLSVLLEHIDAVDMLATRERCVCCGAPATRKPASGMRFGLCSKCGTALLTQSQ